MLLDIKVLNENKVICFNKEVNSTKGPIIKDLAGFWFDKHIDSTVKWFIKILAGFDLINTLPVLWGDSLELL